MARTKVLPKTIRVYWDRTGDTPFLNAMDASEPIPFNEYEDGDTVGTYILQLTHKVKKTIALKHPGPKG